MADQSKNNEENTQDTIFNTEIGDDWGEAFEAEDFMFSPDEESSNEFFLDADSTEDTPSPANEQTITPDAATTRQPLILQNLLSLLSVPFLKNNLFPLYNKAKIRFLAAPFYAKISVAAAPIIILAALYFFTATDDVPPQISIAPPTPEQAMPSLQVESKQMNEHPVEATSANESSEKQIPNPSEPQLASKEVELDKKVPKIIEKKRKRWKLPSFLIAANSETGSKEPSLLSIDITFVLLIPETDALPEGKEYYAREIIYQFFKNRPLSELQRYSLARGEMNRNLRAWVEKQWPEIPLAAIVFDSYKFL